MKRKLALVLCSMTVLALTACGGPKEMPTGTTTETKTATSTEVSEDTTSTSTEASDVTETTEEDDENIKLGVNEPGKYENEFFGVGCTLPDDWTFLTQEEINENNQLTVDLTDNSAVKNAFENNTVLTDMMASCGQDSVNVTIEKLQSAAKLIDEQKYAELSEPQLKTQFESMGVTYVGSNIGEMDFAGSKRVTLDIELKAGDVTIFEKMVLIKKGGYMFLTTACTFNENTTDDIFANFYAVESK